MDDKRTTTDAMNDMNVDMQRQTAAMRGEQKGLPVAGYKPTQSAEAIAAVNVFKELEERVLRHIEDLEDDVIGDPNVGALYVDGRLLSIGRTQLQGAFMFLARAVFQPGRVTLPEDAAFAGVLEDKPQAMLDVEDDG